MPADRNTFMGSLAISFELLQILTRAIVSLGEILKMMIAVYILLLGTANAVNNKSIPIKRYASIQKHNGVEIVTAIIIISTIIMKN